MKLLFLPCSYTSPSARFRVLQFVEPLSSLGHQVCVRVIRPERAWKSPLRQPALGRLHGRAATAVRLLSAGAALRDAEDFDVIFMNRDLLPETRIQFLEPLLARSNPRVVFDYDDAIFLGSRADKLRRILPDVSAVTAGNENLAAFARDIHPDVTIVPTVVDTDYFRPLDPRPERPVRVGWTGSWEPMRDYLPLVKGALTKLARRHSVEFVVICNRKLPFSVPNVTVRHVPWRAATEAEDLQQIDIGLMPLADGEFERCKNGTKAILYMAAGIPAVISPVGASREIVTHGVTGFHCSSEGEWCAALETLMRDPQLRRRMGAAGRRRAQTLYSTKTVLPQLIKLFERVAARRMGGSRAFVGRFSPAGAAGAK